jgi:hypothetical protein
MATSRSRRNNGRISLARTIHLSFGDYPDGSYRTSDISLTGMSVTGPSPKPIGHPCTVTIAEKWSDVTCQLTFSGQVIRNTPDGLAIRYTAMPIEIYELLQTILLYGSDNPLPFGEEFSRNCPYPVLEPDIQKTRLCNKISS